MLQRVRETMDDIWQEVRDLGIVVPHALNPEDLPLALTEEGQLVLVTEVHFDYRGPAAGLQLGVGWKSTTPLDFNNGLSLLNFPYIGYGWSNPFTVPESTVWTPYTRDLSRFGEEAILMAPAVEDNFQLDGTRRDIGYGREVDAWVWIYVVAELGLYAFGPDADFLAIDTDSGVIRMPGAPVVESEVRELEVRYSL